MKAKLNVETVGRGRVSSFEGSAMKIELARPDLTPPPPEYVLRLNEREMAALLIALYQTDAPEIEREDPALDVNAVEAVISNIYLECLKKLPTTHAALARKQFAKKEGK